MNLYHYVPSFFFFFLGVKIYQVYTLHQIYAVKVYTAENYSTNLSISYLLSSLNDPFLGTSSAESELFMCELELIVSELHLIKMQLMQIIEKTFQEMFVGM